MVPPTFFLEAERYRTTPFWRHKSVRPLEEFRGETPETAGRPVEGDENVDVDEDEDDRGGGEGDDEEEEFIPA